MHIHEKEQRREWATAQRKMQQKLLLNCINNLHSHWIMYEANDEQWVSNCAKKCLHGKMRKMRKWLIDFWWLWHISHAIFSCNQEFYSVYI